ncbi:MAG: tetratricopeptide repeat protein [Alphaproteobacteria bacterium]|nr:tetratricopeptide repeat protein [Alphaproteobacteria bacterium]
MEELKQNALDLLKSGDYEKAAKIYLKLAITAPTDEKLLIAAANCYDKLKEKKVALSLYKKALELNPASIPALINAATIYYEIKKYDKALTLSLKVLELEPDNFSALQNAGNACYGTGNYEEALSYYENMYRLHPNSYNALLNIAGTAYNLGDNQKAIDYAKQAIAKRPTSAEPYILTGNAYIELSNNEEASAYLKKAAEIAPTSDWLMSSIANLCQKAGNLKQCLHYAWKAITLKAGRLTADDHINFAYLLYEAKEENEDEALTKYITRWQQTFPDNPIVKHAASALLSLQDIAYMDLSYVKGLFDSFAPSFDEILNQLEYQAPALIAATLKDNLKTKLFKKRRILDLGCGTGLVAENLKQYFENEEFYGVDISERMLEVAGKKGLYKALYADDIISFLETNEEVYHAVTAGDVFTYLGDLKPLFRLLAKTVKFNGLLCFSISKNQENNNDYFLMPSGRFVHTLSYVNRLLKHCGFKTLSANVAVLRHEGVKEVEGYIVLAQKEIEVIFE